MAALRLNHVSIHANDLDESARFYADLFGMRRVPTPAFPGVRVLWLQLGDQQLHLFARETPTPAPTHHHIGLDVDDFASVYRRAKERGLLDPEAWERQLRRHPSGWVQMYLRDPAGNLVEVDWPDATTLPPDIVDEMTNLEDDVPQMGEARVATLYTATEVAS